MRMGTLGICQDLLGDLVAYQEFPDLLHSLRSFKDTTDFGRELGCLKIHLEMRDENKKTTYFVKTTYTLRTEG